MRYLLVVGMLAGCGGGDDLTCEYLASDENCFKTTAMNAVGCLPPEGAVGTLSSDFATCTYTTGQVVTFTPPLVLPMDFDTPWNFTVETDGQPCLEFHEIGEDGFDLTVLGETVSERLNGRGLELSCPDGSTFSNGNALELLSCPGESFGDLPGNTSNSGIDSVFFGFINTGLPDTLVVFDCQ